MSNDIMVYRTVEGMTIGDMYIVKMNLDRLHTACKTKCKVCNKIHNIPFDKIYESRYNRHMFMCMSNGKLG